MYVCILGLYSNHFDLAYPTQVGTWHMVVNAYVSYQIAISHFLLLNLNLLGRIFSKYV